MIETRLHPIAGCAPRRQTGQRTGTGVADAREANIALALAAQRRESGSTVCPSPADHWISVAVTVCEEFPERKWEMLSFLSWQFLNMTSPLFAVQFSSQQLLGCPVFVAFLRLARD